MRLRLGEITAKHGIKAACRAVSHYRALARPHDEWERQRRDLAACEAGIAGLKALLVEGLRLPRLVTQRAPEMLRILEAHHAWLAPMARKKRPGGRGWEARTMLVVALGSPINGALQDGWTPDDIVAAAILAGLLTEADVRAHRAETLEQAIAIERERVRAIVDRVAPTPERRRKQARGRRNRVRTSRQKA